MNAWLRNGVRGMDARVRIIDAVSAVRCGACMSEEEIHVLIAGALRDAGIDDIVAEKQRQLDLFVQ